MRIGENGFENHSTDPGDGRVEKEHGSKNMFRKLLGLNNNRNN